LEIKELSLLLENNKKLNSFIHFNFKLSILEAAMDTETKSQ